MLPNYKSILFATDLTANSEHAFKHAILLARQTKAKIHILHVIPEVDASFRSYVSAVMGQGQLEQYEEQHEDQALEKIKKKLEDFTQRELTDYPEDLKNISEIEVLHGHPVTKILQVAAGIQADVIVMGTHGKGALEHTFIGSVAEKVLHKAKRPVFTIPLLD
jgi:nucleotide-binding universal stress UspA family protein